MLICKNCDTENIDGAQKCHHCQMEGHLVCLRPEHEQPEIVRADHPPLSCKNCGCEAPGEGEKCVECHFPNPHGRSRNGSSVLHRHSHSLLGSEVKHLNQ